MRPLYTGSFVSHCTPEDMRTTRQSEAAITEIEDSDGGTQDLSLEVLERVLSRQAANVRLVEVGPRDGLQNEQNIVPLDTKIELIERLAKTGLRDIEAGAFVSPKWIPQMADSSRILERLITNPPAAGRNVSYSFLVPNIKGLENALAISTAASASEQQRTPSITSSNNANLPPTPPHSPSPEAMGAQITSAQYPNDLPSSTSSTSPQPNEVSVFAAATETFSQKNTNCSIATSLERFKPVISLAKSCDVRVRAYVSVVLGCPYEGPNVSSAKVTELAGTLLEMGADEISLGDTTGMGTAPRTLNLHRSLSSAGIPTEKLAMHFHDTYGQALINAAVSLEHGITIFDSSVAGLGGCPYAKGATGNVATEDLLYFLHSVGMDTGVDVEKVAEVGQWISDALGRLNGSRAGKAISSRKD
ncbi:MAG: hypothetical protein M1837_005870 [Sclerophora amabilis]|nr:MAG: hypothetical protein M1837_005870 [Sclerophora amabilis]